MTNTIHNLLPVSIFTDNSKPASSNDRLSIIRWKKTEQVQKPHPAVCISVPKPVINVTPQCLQASLIEAFYNLQDTLIRSLIEANTNKLQSIPETSITQEATAAFAEAENESKRLSGDTITKWFTQYVHDNLILALANKAGINDPTETQMTQLENNATSAAKLLSSLASPRSMYPEATILQLQKVIALADTDGNELSSQLSSKLTKMLEPKDVSLALDL